jgi:hypothetical protein
MRKKGDMSINVIILATLAIVTLIILLYFLTHGFSSWRKTTSCQGLSNVCATSCEELGDNYVTDSGHGGKEGGCEPNQVCCMKVT